MGWSDWIRAAEIEPSLYGADLAHLGDETEALLAAGCRVFHFDVGDGHFIEPITMGPIVLQAVAPIAHRGGGAMDVHLMVESPAKYFEPVARAGGDSVTFHIEAVDDVPGTIRAAREQRLQVGVAFNPETEPEDVAAVSDRADIVLCMSIHPGYSGTPFQEAAFGRIARLRELLPERVHIQVDGGVGLANAARLRECGATLLVAASSIFATDDPPAAYRGLVQAIA
ncbi:MAG TPA: ribulose-phosphate 3-epimerase [Gaiellaceae bacterium]|jgi:ribulose-phosphate 3-epimerase|nr:ribulose-phosphate 3-epimerase [Gaiellaceae bacterium]